MPLDRLVLIIVLVIAAGLATVWLGALVVSAAVLPVGWLGLIPTLLAAYVVWRVVSDRMRSAEDDHYDRME